MSVYIRPFRKDDLTAFEPMEPMEKDELLEIAEIIEKSQLAVTGLRNGKVVGCGGVHPIMDSNQGELWLRLSKDCLKHRIDTLRWLKSGLKIIEETYPFRQLNAAVKCGYESGMKLIEYFGFKRTQTKNGFVIYSKLVKE